MKYFIEIFFLITIVIGFFVMVYMHEQVHIIIFDSYGIDSHVEYFSHFPDFVTIPDNTSNGTCTESCILAHNINKAITYPLFGFYILIAIGLLVIILELDSMYNTIQLILEVEILQDSELFGKNGK